MTCLIHIVASVNREGMTFTGTCMELLHKLSFIVCEEGPNAATATTLDVVLEWYVVGSDGKNSICIIYIKTV